VGGEKAVARSGKVHHGIRDGSTMPVAHTKSGKTGKPPDKRLLLDQEVAGKGQYEGSQGPTDILHDSPRVQLYTEEEVKEARENDVDLLEEARELA
jgi:hypothetical protein